MPAPTTTLSITTRRGRVCWYVCSNVACNGTFTVNFNFIVDFCTTKAVAAWLIQIPSSSLRQSQARWQCLPILANSHHSLVEGFCYGLPAGDYIVALRIGSCYNATGQPNAYTGCCNSTSRMSVSEVRMGTTAQAGKCSVSCRMFLACTSFPPADLSYIYELWKASLGICTSPKSLNDNNMPYLWVLSDGHFGKIGKHVGY